jgi:hypothetical protein
MASEEAAAEDHSGGEKEVEEEVVEEEEEKEDEGGAILDPRCSRSHYVQNMYDSEDEEYDPNGPFGWELLRKHDLELGANPQASVTGPSKHTFGATVVSSVQVLHKDREVRKKMDVPILVEVQRGNKLVTTAGSDIAFMYGLLTYETTEATSKHPRSIRQLDSSVFVPKISHMF